MNGPQGRGSRFFPQAVGGHPYQDRRAFTYSHPEPPRTPSPPPAEEYASFHPAFDGDSARPVVHFPREKAVVRLPPAMPPTPPTPVQSQAAPAPVLEAPMTWAARVSMPPPAPAPAPAPALRSASTPIVQNPSWQERFNGLLGKKTSPVRDAVHPIGTVLAVASSTREPLDVQHVLVPAASVSLPLDIELEVTQQAMVVTKDVESEDDLFEDREIGSQPAIKFPRDAPMLPWPAPTFASRILPTPIEPLSASPFMVNNLFGRHHPPKPQFALIRFPGSAKPIKKDIPVKGQASSNGGKQRFGSGPPSSSGSFTGKNSRNRAGPRSRQSSKAH